MYSSTHSGKIRRYLPSLMDRSSRVAISIFTLERPKPSSTATSAGEYHLGFSVTGGLVIGARSFQRIVKVVLPVKLASCGQAGWNLGRVVTVLTGACSGAVGQEGVAGRVPAGADEFKEVDDQRFRLVR